MDYKTQMNWLPPRTKVTLIDTASRPVLDRAVVRKLAIKKVIEQAKREAIKQ
mgnify:CR=1 FL=1